MSFDVQLVTQIPSKPRNINTSGSFFTQFLHLSHLFSLLGFSPWISLAILELHINGIIQYVFVCKFLFSVFWDSSLCFRLVSFHCRVVCCINMPQFNFSCVRWTAGGQWAVSHWAIINKVAMNLLCKPFCGPMF